MNELQLDRALDTIHRGRTRLSDPLALHERAMAVPSTTPQQRGWLPPISKRRFQSMFSATKFVVAGAIVALFGGFLLAGVLTQPSEDAPPAVGTSMSPDAMDTHPVMLPAEIPDGIESGSLDTPLGRARWVHLRGDASTLPAGFDGPSLVHSGEYITVQDGDATTPAKLWRSRDLLTWVSEPIPAGGLTLANGTYWLSSYGPASLWRSADTKEWNEVGLDKLIPPGPDGYAWKLQLPGEPLAYDGITIMPYTYSVGHTAGSLGLSDYDDPPATLREDGPGVYTARWDDKHSAILRFEDTGDDLRVIDAEGGDELAVIEGVGMGYIERWASDGPALDVDGLAIMDGDQFIGVDLPDSMDLAVDRALTVDDSGFLAITLGPDGLVHVHRSNDGRIWTETGVVGDDPAGPTDIRYVGADPGSITVWLEADPWMPSPAWTSTDGVTWERGEPEGGRIGWYRFASGWISEIGYPEYFGDSGLIGDRIWFQPRGGVAVAIDIGSLGIGEEPPGGDQADTDEEVGGSALLLSSNSIGYAQHQGERRDIWIITFDDLPA